MGLSPSGHTGVILEASGKCCKRVACGIIQRMEEFHPANILILFRSTETARNWAETLLDRQPPDQQNRVWLSAAEVPEEVQLDLILTDDATGTGSVAHPGGQPDSQADADRPAVIALGDEASADVCLPPDATPRELRLACRLLLEIVRLRRSLRARADAQHRLAREASTDPLTGIPNRRAWDQQLAERLALLPSPGNLLCLAIFDLDHFKRVNDACGHMVGDQVLRNVAKTLGDHLRQGDFVARLGGDEFGLLLAIPDPSTAMAVVERVRRALPEGLSGAGLPAVTASAGLCLVVPQVRSDALGGTGVSPVHCGSTGQPPVPPDALLAAADAALREAKREGRDRVAQASSLS